MRRWCTSPQNNRNHRWGRHLVSPCQHLFEPSILWPACNCSCARHYLLRSLPVFSLFRQNGGCTRQRYRDHEWWPLSIGNDQGWGQTSCCRLYSILVSYRCEIYWPDNAFQDRMVVAIVIHRTPLVTTQVTFFYNSNKFGHSLHGETFLIVDEVFFFKSA